MEDHADVDKLHNDYITYYYSDREDLSAILTRMVDKTHEARKGKYSFDHIEKTNEGFIMVYKYENHNKYIDDDDTDISKKQLYKLTQLKIKYHPKYDYIDIYAIPTSFEVGAIIDGILDAEGEKEE